MIEWLLENFDFINDRIMVNDAEDVGLPRERLREQLSALRNSGREVNLLRTYYFSDDDIGVYFRLRFA